MASSIHEVLFRLTGDEDDARKSLETITAELEAFNAIEAEAEADLDTRGALVRIDELKGALRDLDDETASPNIKADIAGVMAQLKALEAELKELDDQDVVIDVERRGEILSQMATLTRQATLLGRASSKATGDFKSFGSRIADTAVNFGPFTTQLRTAAPLVAGLASVVVSLGGALVALAASLAAAVAGAIALAVAFGAVMATGIFAAIVAVQRFQKESKKPGTAAHELAEAFKEVGQVIKEIGRVVDPIFRALADTVRRFADLIRDLGPALTEFGKAAARSLGPLNKALTDPALRSAIAQIVRLSGHVLTPMVRIGTDLFRIFTNIARAALPYLTEALRDVADLLGGVAAKTADVSRMSEIIGVLVGHLRLWASLFGQLSRLIFSVFRAALPAAAEFVGWLRDAVQAMADWASSEEGQARIKAFFEDVLPLAKSVLSFVAKLVLAFIQFGQIAAPIMKPIVDAFNFLLDIVNWVLDKIQYISPVLRVIGTAAALLFGPFGKLQKIIGGVIAAFGLLKGIAGGVVGLFKRLGGVASKLWHELPGKIAEIWGRIKGIVGEAVGKVTGAISDAWNTIKDKTRALATIVPFIWGRIKDGVSDAASAIWDKIRGAWEKIKAGTALAFHIVVDKIKGAFWGALHWLGDLPAKMFELGKDIVEGIANGIKSVPGIVGDALKDAVLAPVHAIGGALGISSPSKVTIEYGQELGRGFAVGIEKMLGRVARSARGLADAGLPKPGGHGSLAAAGRAAAGAGSTTNNRYTIPVTVAGRSGQPDHRAFVAGVDRELRQRGLSIA